MSVLTSLHETRSDRRVDAGTPIRLAVVGCGAIARQFHVPVLAGHPHVQLVALVDRQVHAAAQLAAAYGVPTVCGDIADLDPDAIDAALIATPPSHHAPAAIHLMRRGLHVLVEKPMAILSSDAQEMVRVAEETGTVLVAGYFRRLFASSRLLQALVQRGALGELVSFDVAEGHVFDWPSATLGSMQRDLAGGGVLIDTGSHTLDQLLFFFGTVPELLEYRDNAYGGVETDCQLRLRWRCGDREVDGHVTLSWTRELRNVFQLDFTHGRVELPVGERFGVKIVPRDSCLADTLRLPPGVETHVRWSGDGEPPIYAAFRAQLDDWLGAIRHSGVPQLSGRSVLPTVQLIEACYRGATRLDEPWVRVADLASQTGARPAAPGDTDGPSNGRAPGTSHRTDGPGRVHSPTRRPRVLITGATGFIGGRLAEVLALSGEYAVRALVRQPARAARLARLPVEMVLGDLHNQADVHRAVEGCDYVVHCAYGTAWGNAHDMRAVTVEGTRSLARAAQRSGVLRLVHLSTWAIHGTDVTGTVDENTPVRPGRDIYARTKAEAERVVASSVRHGLPAVVMRLTNVYGPFSGPFTVRPVLHLQQHSPVLLGAGQRPSNTIYVDNVVHAIRLALVAPAQRVAGQTYLIADADGTTWCDYYQYYAEALGTAMRALSEAEFDALRARQARPLRSLRSLYPALRALLTSDELIALGKKTLNTAPIGTVPRWLLERFPAWKEALRRRVQADRPPVYRPNAAASQALPPVELFELYACAATASPAKAARDLGYGAIIARDQAMALTLQWLRYARLIG